jgi:hypothetical protein
MSTKAKSSGKAPELNTNGAANNTAAKETITATVLVPIEHNGTRYEPNDAEPVTLELTEHEAKPLLAVNAIRVSDHTDADQAE